MSETILECFNLVKYYGGKEALKGIDLKIGKGKIVGLLGPNGSGKTTFIKLANGLLKPSSGEIKIGGMEVGPETHKIISYLPERTYLNDWMKVSEIIQFFKDFYEDFDEKRANDMLKKLNIEVDARLKTLSKGTKEMCIRDRNVAVQTSTGLKGITMYRKRTVTVVAVILNFTTRSCLG